MLKSSITKLLLLIAFSSHIAIAQTGLRSITCKVLDRETHLPINNAKVYLNDVQSGVTDSSGIFLIKNVDKGEYRIKASTEGFFNKSDTVSISDNENKVVQLELQPIHQNVDPHWAIYFDRRSFNLRKESLSILDSVAKTLREYDKIILLLEGNSDAYENKRNDTLLSYQRAVAAKNYLIKSGINENRLSVRGFGTSRPIAPCDRKKKWKSGCKLNRRVEWIAIGGLSRKE